MKISGCQYTDNLKFYQVIGKKQQYSTISFQAERYQTNVKLKNPLELVANGIVAIIDTAIQLADVWQNYRVEKADARKREAHETFLKLSSQVETISQDELVASINKTYKRLKVNSKLQYKDVTNEELLKYFCENLNIFMSKGKLALKEALRIQSEVEVERVSIMKDYIAEFRKGPNYYVDEKLKKTLLTCPIEEITLDEKLLSSRNLRDLKEPLKIALATFNHNTVNIDELLISFNELSKNYFEEAAVGINSIYELQKGKNRILEKFPYVGVVFAAYRANEQISMVKELLCDYEDVTRLYVKDGVVPVMQKYFQQGRQIYDFMSNILHLIETEADKKLFEDLMQSLYKNKSSRMGVYKNLFNMYATRGMNIEKLTKKADKKVKIGLAVKLASTLLKAC